MTKSGARELFWPNKFGEWVEVVSKCLLIVGTLIAAGWGYYEYVDRQNEARIAMTISYFRRFSDGRLQQAQERLGLAWYAVRDRLHLLEATPVTSAEEFEARRRQLVMMVIDHSPSGGSAPTPRSLASDVDAIESFFGDLQVCLDASLCDRRTAVSYFKDYARRFYCLHEPYILWKSQTYASDYGDGVKGFVQSSAKTAALCN